MLYIGSTPVAFSKTCDLTVQRNMISTANKMSGNWESNLPGTMSWSVSCDALYTRASGDTSYDTLFASMVAGTPVDITIGIATDGTFALGTGLYTGKALIDNLPLKAEENGVASCTVSLKGSGALTKAV